MIHFKFHTSWLFIKLGMLQCLRNVLLKGFELFWIHAWSQNSECREMITYVPAAWSFTCDSERWILLVYLFCFFISWGRQMDPYMTTSFIFFQEPVWTCTSLFHASCGKAWKPLIMLLGTLGGESVLQPFLFHIWSIPVILLHIHILCS